MTLRCPRCGEPVRRAEMSVAKDFARCRCGFGGGFSELIGAAEPAGPRRGFKDGIDEPWGAWRARRGEQVIIGALNLSWSAATMLLIGVVFGIGWIAALLDTLAQPSTDVTHIVGVVIAGLSAVCCLGAGLFLIWGHVEVVLGREQGLIVTGLGPLKLTRRFVPHDVEGISERECQPGLRRRWPAMQLQLHGPSGLLFGWSLCARHRHFIRAAIESELGLLRPIGRRSQPAEVVSVAKAQGYEPEL